jgi:hypothetical protein
MIFLRKKLTDSWTKLGTNSWKTENIMHVFLANIVGLVIVNPYEVEQVRVS